MVWAACRLPVATFFSQQLLQQRHSSSTTLSTQLWFVPWPSGFSRLSKVRLMSAAEWLCAVCPPVVLSCPGLPTLCCAAFLGFAGGFWSGVNRHLAGGHPSDHRAHPHQQPPGEGVLQVLAVSAAAGVAVMTGLVFAPHLQQISCESS